MRNQLPWLETMKLRGHWKLYNLLFCENNTISIQIFLDINILINIMMHFAIKPQFLHSRPVMLRLNTFNLRMFHGKLYPIRLIFQIKL